VALVTDAMLYVTPFCGGNIGLMGLDVIVPGVASVVSVMANVLAALELEPQELLATTLMLPFAPLHK